GPVVTDRWGPRPVAVTAEPDATVFEQLRALAEDHALLQAAVDQLADSTDRHARLAKAVTARHEEFGRRLAEAVALLPRGRGRPELEEIPAVFLQEIRRLRDEEGWGRPRILAVMRPHGITDWQLRKQLERDAGGKRGSRSR